MATDKKIDKKINNKFNYNNIKKLNKNFMYKDLRRSNCYNCDFTGSNFNYASFRGAQFKSCNFYGVTFDSTEFIATNFKKSKFKHAKFENAIFDSVNLEGVDFKDATFKNVIFVSTDISKSINLNLIDGNVKIFEEMPKLKISGNLKKAVKGVMTNPHVKAARVLDTKTGTISPISTMILLEKFDEETLIKGLNLIEKELDKEFSTLSYIIKSLENYKEQGLI